MQHELFFAKRLFLLQTMEITARRKKRWRRRMTVGKETQLALVVFSHQPEIHLPTFCLLFFASPFLPDQIGIFFSSSYIFSSQRPTGGRQFKGVSFEER
jgi:hypothetical protein